MTLNALASNIALAWPGEPIFRCFGPTDYHFADVMRDGYHDDKRLRPLLAANIDTGIAKLRIRLAYCRLLLSTAMII